MNSVLCGGILTYTGANDVSPNFSGHLYNYTIMRNIKLLSLQLDLTGCWNRGVPLHTEVSSFQGVGIEVPLYTEVSSFQGVGIEEFQCIQRCPHFRG